MGSETVDVQVQRQHEGGQLGAIPVGAILDLPEPALRVLVKIIASTLFQTKHMYAS